MDFSSLIMSGQPKGVATMLYGSAMAQETDMKVKLDKELFIKRQMAEEERLKEEKLRNIRDEEERRYQAEMKQKEMERQRAEQEMGFFYSDRKVSTMPVVRAGTIGTIGMLMGPSTQPVKGPGLRLLEQVMTASASRGLPGQPTRNHIMNGVASGVMGVLGSRAVPM